MKKILILGGDGYLGWPAALRFSNLGWNVALVDNYMKRDLCRKLGCSPLYAVPTMEKRAAAWRQQEKGRTLKTYIGDATDNNFLGGVFQVERPDAVIHFAEQPSAPLSMLDYKHGALTLQNNLMSTFNVLHCMKRYTPEAHLIKLGTLGEYGTPNIDIEEGWLDVEHKGRKQKFLFPRQGGSVYHSSKIHDTDLIWFHVRNDGLRVTDLMQGPVYGLNTTETTTDHQLRTTFYYDEIFGTVLNRFMVQAAVGAPLTVYGSGTQQRGFINIEDSLQCLTLAADSSVEAGELRILNQFTEVFSVRQLAGMVKEVGDAMGLQVALDEKPNPRVESEEHYYNPSNDGFKQLGLKPHLLTPDLLENMMRVVGQHTDLVDREIIFRGVKW